MSGSTAEVRYLWTDAADRAIGLPSYATDGAAGADLRANFPPSQRARGLPLVPGGRAVVPTGLIVAVPEGFELQLRARSGLALRHGLILPNAPATIDSDYRGPLGIVLANLGAVPVVIGHGDRIAQAVLAPVTRMRFVEVPSLDATVRGTGGFGSTGRS